ncbi:MAG: hypothetical protein ACR2F6_00540 [Mycobacteriales bacterium]
MTVVPGRRQPLPPAAEEPMKREPAALTAPTWATAPEAVRVVVHRPNLWRTGLTALIVGTVLFAINQLDVVLAGSPG